jgi:uncharacterized protein YndB with AHSA1/START domain
MGGRIYEVTRGGAEEDWGEVLAWDPPGRLEVSWGGTRRSRPRTRWTATFTAVGEDRTRLDLVHRGWEALGDEADDLYARYDGGWDLVLGRFSDAAD